MEDGFTYTTSNLNGHAPSLVGSGTWQTHNAGTATISTAGAGALLVTDGGTPGGGSQAIGDYAFTPAANTIYTLQTTWVFTGLNSAGADCWVASGMTNGTGGGPNGPWMLIRPQVTSTSTSLAVGSNGASYTANNTVPAADFSAPIVTTQIWNTGTGQIQFYINGVLQSNWALSTSLPTGTYYAFMQAFKTGNLVKCTNMTLYAEEASGTQMQDNFTYTTTNITGHAPTRTPGGWGTWTTWLGTGSIATDGTKALLNTNASGAPGSGQVIADYAFTPFSNSIYTATATFNFTSAANVDCWAGLGFSSSGTNHAPWMLIRPPGVTGGTGSVAAESNGAGWTGNSATLPASYYNGPVTAMVTWNTTTGIAQFYVNDLLVLTAPIGSAYVPTGGCNIFFQAYNLGNIVNVSNVSLLNQDSTGPQVWLSTDTSQADFASLFTTPNTAWPTAQSRTTAIQLNDGDLQGYGFTTHEASIEQALVYCHNNGIQFAISTYGLQQQPPNPGAGFAGCGYVEGYNALVQTNEDVTNLKAAITADGGTGTLDRVFFDGPFESGVLEAPPAAGQDNGGCQLSIATAAQETATVIEIFQAGFPNVQFVDDEPIGAVSSDVTGLETYEADVAADVNAYNSAHHISEPPFAFVGFHTDMDWRNDPYPALSPLFPSLAANNTAFGIIFNSGGWWNSALKCANNAQNMLAQDENVQEYNASGLPNPLGMVNFASWNTPPTGTVGEYTTSGSTVNSSLITGLTGATGITISGSNMYVINAHANTIGEYTTAGTVVNAALPNSEGYWATGLVVSGSKLLIANGEFNHIDQYDPTASPPTLTTIVSGLHNAMGIALSGSNIFVLNGDTGTVGEYTTTGTVVNASLITGLNHPSGIAVSGTNLFIVNSGSGTIGEYTTSGTVVNASLVSGLSLTPNLPIGIVVSGSDIFVSKGGSLPGTGVIGEYTTSGAVVNASLVTGLNEPAGLAISGSTLFVDNNAEYGLLPTNLLPESTYGTSTNGMDFFFNSPLAFQPPPTVLDMMYYPPSKAYYFSTSYPEIASKVAAGWLDEAAVNWSGGVGGIEPSASCAPNLVPLYQYTRISGGNTFYAYSTSSASGAEGIALNTNGYGSPTLKGYVFANSDSADGGVALYEYYNSTLNSYFYQTSSATPAVPAGYSLVTTYQGQGVLCYVMPRFMPAPGYIWELPAAWPGITPYSGTYTGSQTVTLTSSTPGASIYYTTNGYMPTTSSSSVPSGGTITISASETLNTMSVVPGYNNSQMRQAVYTIH